MSRRIRWSLAILLLVVIAGGWWLSRPDSPPPSVGTEGTGSEEPLVVTGTAPLAQAPKEKVIEAVTESGIPVRIVQPVAIQRPRPPFGPGYAALLSEAEAGDAPAQYELALLLYQCRDVPEDAASLERQVDKVHQTRKRGTWEVADPSAEVSTLRRSFEDCAGVPAAARNTYRDWMRKAADAGLMQAQLDVMYHLPQREYCQYLYQCTAEQKKVQAALQAESLHYVGLARDAGSASALWTFGAWYQGDEVLPANDIEAYAHYYALDQIQRAAGLQRRVQPMLTALDRKLRPIDRSQAEARARELLSNPRCCVVTP